MMGGRADRRTGGRWLAVAGTALLLTTACGRKDRVVVGAKNFTESDLLAEIVGQQIERRTHLRVERRFHLGGTFVCHEAITSGRIDLYVEYTGTAYTAVLKRPPPSIAAPESVYAAVASDYAQRFGLRWGKPFGFVLGTRPQQFGRAQEAADMVGAKGRMRHHSIPPDPASARDSSLPKTHHAGRRR